ncbi:MAG: hypothetical protein DRJ15_10730, partial [Bacteroidetes bacterium]
MEHLEPLALVQAQASQAVLWLLVQAVLWLGAGGGLMSMLGEAGGGIMSILGGGEDEEGGMSGG